MMYNISNMEWIDIKTVYTIAHLLGVAIGAGGAYMSGLMFMSTIKDNKISKREVEFLELGSKMVWGGVGVLLVSGALLVSLNPSAYMTSSKFILKMIIVAVVILNGLIFQKVHSPLLLKSVNKKISTSKTYKKGSRFMYISGAVSIASWTSALVLGALRSIPITVSRGLAIYLAILAVGAICAEVYRRVSLSK